MFRENLLNMPYSISKISISKIEGRFVASKFWDEMNSAFLSFRFSANENKACWCKEEMLYKNLLTNKYFRLSLVVDVIDT